MSPFSRTESFSPAFAAVLDYAAAGGADQVECLQAADEIRDGDCESWHLSWIHLAERVRRLATINLSAGREAEAHAAFLRSAHYYRAAGHFLGRNPNDARIATTAEAVSACFSTAMRLSDPLWVSETVFVDGIRHTANLYRCDDDPRPRATVLAIGDAGVTPVDLCFSCAVAANRCGWNCLTIAMDRSDPVRAAQSLLDAAIRLDAIDRECLGLLTFDQKPTMPLEMVRHLRAPLQLMGSVDQLADALHRNPLKSSETFETLQDFHRHFSRWLGKVA